MGPIARVSSEGPPVSVGEHGVRNLKFVRKDIQGLPVRFSPLVAGSYLFN